MKKITLLFCAVCFLAAGVFFMGFDDPRGGRHNSDPNFRVPVVHNEPPVSDAATKFVDSLNGDNSLSGLAARGYKTVRNGTGSVGVSDIWYQGDPLSIGVDAFNGPPSGFVGADYNCVTSGNIDNWLISPKMNVATGDTLSFYAVSYNSDAYPDSIRVMYSPVGDSTATAASWVELGRFRILESVANSETWAKHSYVMTVPGVTGRIAIRYCTVDGGPSGANCSTIGIDYIRLGGLISAVTPVSTEIPGAYKLSQNYPNPFNPSTKINFSIPKNGLVTLKVYDMLGKEVATLVDEVKNAGTYEADFNGASLSSGIYSYTIKSGEFTQTKKMMLVK